MPTQKGLSRSLETSISACSRHTGATFYRTAGTQAGSILRLREQGLYPLNKRGDRGSLYVNIGVEIPKDLSREEKELYQKLAELRHDKETAQEESFLEKMKNLFK